jgi:epoxyqueuosine reductase QueG
VSATERSAEVKRRGAALGFDAIGVTAIEPNAHAAALDAWLGAGHAGTMRYLHRRARVPPS